VLPDGRQWELVSPADTYGALLEPYGVSVVQASVEGNAITYGANAPIGANPPSNDLNSTQILSKRGPSGWSSQDISTPAEEPLEAGSVLGQFPIFSSDLSLAVAEPFSKAPLSPGASGTSFYLRENATGNFVYLGKRQIKSNASSYITSTPDFRHIIFTSNGQQFEGSFFEWSDGREQPIQCGGSIGFVGEPTPPALHAISADGSRFICDGKAELLSLGDIASGESIQLNVPEPGCQPCSNPGFRFASFQAASSEDSRIFFTDEQKLTADSSAQSGGFLGNGSPDLYEFKVTSGAGEKLAGEVTDLSVPINEGEAADVRSPLIGASEDGSYVYFGASGDLAPGATPGGLNIYVNHDGTTTFIATLSAEDRTFNGSEDGGNPSFNAHFTPLISHNGRYLTFMSERELTGYDNVDDSPEAKGAHDEEVFLYDAQTNRLACVSCDPTGARPLGLFDEVSPETHSYPLVDAGFDWLGRWIAGVIPGYAQRTLGSGPYQSRYLSDEGRLFFDSSDALVPQHTSGKMAVYEYEPEGVGSCARSSTTFHESTDGCVGLLSPGTSGEEAAFLDASENGNDVFFLAAGKLTSANMEGLNVYDARVCSEAEPCPAEVVPAPTCVTADSCRAAQSPQPTLFGASGSATFSGAGNVPPASTPVTGPAGTKSLTRAQKLARVLRACHKNRGRKRTVCERQAKRQYGAKPKASRKGGR
jgi:hypothetical protein